MFEWDETKRIRTFETRGLDFADAFALFDGRPNTTFDARTDVEERFLTIGALDDGKLYAVVWTQRAEAKRIIIQEGAR